MLVIRLNFCLICYEYALYMLVVCLLYDLLYASQMLFVCLLYDLKSYTYACHMLRMYSSGR